jgi:hypothetical protein
MHALVLPTCTPEYKKKRNNVEMITNYIQDLTCDPLSVQDTCGSFVVLYN